MKEFERGMTSMLSDEEEREDGYDNGTDDDE